MNSADLPWLLANVLAWPLCSPVSGVRGYLPYRSRDVDNPGTPTHRLTRSFLRWARPVAPGFSTGELADLCLWAWFRNGDIHKATDYLTGLKQSVDAEVLTHLRLIVPIAALTAAWGTARRSSLPFKTAETHVHIAGAAPWSLTWVSTLAEHKPNSKRWSREDWSIRTQIALAGVLRAGIVWRLAVPGRHDCDYTEIAEDLATETGDHAGEFKSVFAEAQRLVNRSSGARVRDQARVLRVCAVISKNVKLDADEEVVFLRRGWSISGPGEGEFGQYLRLFILAHNWMTHDPGTVGVPWFSDAFRRQAVLCRHKDVSLRAILQAVSGEKNLVAWEGRTTPDQKKVEQQVKAFGQAAKLTIDKGGRTSFALLLHLNRTPPNKPVTRILAPWRDLESWYAEAVVLAREVSRVINSNPWFLGFLRGLDVCGDERLYPTWAAAPFFKIAREASLNVAARLGRPELALRATAHAGEEYRRNTEGIRRIHELFDFKIVQQDDRLGHGLALFDFGGARSGPSVQLVRDRIDDLLWLWELCCAIPSGHRRLRTSTEGHLRTLLRRCYNAERPNLDDHVAARRLRYDHDMVYGTLGFGRAGERRPPGNGVSSILWDYLFDQGVHDEGRKSMLVGSMCGEQEFLAVVQGQLCDRIAALGVTIEANPTSNRHIKGRHAADADALPISSPAARKLCVSISTDDPTFFATTLEDEYAAAEALLKGRGVRSLRQIAKHGLDSAFALSLKQVQVLLEEGFPESRLGPAGDE